jgi:hypothetical protein
MHNQLTWLISSVILNVMYSSRRSSSEAELDKLLK